MEEKIQAIVTNMVELNQSIFVEGILKTNKGESFFEFYFYRTMNLLYSIKIHTPEVKKYFFDCYKQGKLEIDNISIDFQAITLPSKEAEEICDAIFRTLPIAQ